MCHHQRRSRHKFNGEIAVGNRVERILANAVEAQFFRNVFAVDWITGARQSSRTQRRSVHPFAAIEQARFITRKHFHVGHHVVAECHRLRDLQMGESRHDGIGVLFGQPHQRQLHRAQQVHQAINLTTQPQPNIGCNLIVA